jgi:hypothetical protein
MFLWHWWSVTDLIPARNDWQRIAFIGRQSDPSLKRNCW